jgi:hypothetical protein
MTFMKKFLPIIIFLAGLAIVAGAYFFVVRGRNNDVDNDEGMEVNLVDRPILSLVPRSDGHWLDMTVEKLKIKGATNMEYLLIYTVEDDGGSRQQGVPGTLEIEGQDKLTAELLLGSESRGNYRYDEGVERGTFTITFRNDNGRTLAKFESRFRMYTDTTEMVSADGNFSIELDEVSDDYYVILDSIGVPGDQVVEPTAGPYGFYSSQIGLFAGKVEVISGELQFWSGSKWEGPGDDLSPGVYFSL